MQYLWLRLPKRVARFWPSGAVTLSDGHYLLRWPAAAWTFAAMAMALGLASGRLHEGRTYVSSLVILLFFAVIGQGGASLGIFAMIGWVIGDLFLNPYPHKIALPGQLLTYVLLGLLAVVLPLGVLMVRRAFAAIEAIPRNVIPYAEPVVAAIAAGAGAYAWARTLPVLIAPAYPSPGQVETLNALLFAGAVALAGALRAVLEWAALHGSEMKTQSQELWADLSRQSRRGPVPGIPGLLLIVFGAAGTTALLWGLTANLVEVFIVLMFFGALLFVRFYLQDGPARRAAALARIPLTVRLVLALALAYAASRTVIQVFSHGNSRLPALVAVCLAALFLTLLTLPDPAKRSKEGLEAEYWVKQEDDWKAEESTAPSDEPETLGWEDSLGQPPVRPPGRTLGRAADPTELAAWNAGPGTPLDRPSDRLPDLSPDKSSDRFAGTGRTSDRFEDAGWNEGSGRHVVAPWNEPSGMHEAAGRDVGRDTGSGRREVPAWNEPSGKHEAAGRDVVRDAGSGRSEIPAWNEPSGRHEAAGWNEGTGRHEVGERQEGSGRRSGRGSRRETPSWDQPLSQAPSQPLSGSPDQPLSQIPGQPMGEPFSEPSREPGRRGKRAGRGVPPAEPVSAPMSAPVSEPVRQEPVRQEPVRQEEASGRGKRWGRGKQAKEKPPAKEKSSGRGKSSGQDEFLSWHESLKRDASAEEEGQDPWK